MMEQPGNGVLGGSQYPSTPILQHSNTPVLQYSSAPINHGAHAAGFTLLEVMVAMAIIAMALVAALGSQSQGVSLAGRAKFATTAGFLAQRKMAGVEEMVNEGKCEELRSDSGDFGDDFPGYRWEIEVGDVGLSQTSTSPETEHIFEHLRKLVLSVSWGEGGAHRFPLVSYLYCPRPE